MTATVRHVPVPLAYYHQTNASETSRWKNLYREVVIERCSLYNVYAYNNDQVNQHNYTHVGLRTY